MTRLLALLIALVATPAMAFDGVYGDCAGTGDAVPIVIAGDRVVFYESECRLTNPVVVRDMPGAVLFDATCTGEGDTWGYRLFLQRTEAGGIIMLRQGIVQELPRCP